MKLSATKTSEILSTELADDVLEEFWNLISEFANKPWDHGLNFVIQRLLPAVIIAIALLAVVLVVVVFVLLHLGFAVERVSTALVAALDRLERCQRGDHLDT